MKKPIVCCDTNMTLISCYYDSGDGDTYYVFQCQVCGNIEEVEKDELDEV